jgi:hypothetical protein
LLKESTARVSAKDWVSQGGQTLNAIRTIAMHTPSNNFPRMASLLLFEGRQRV